MKNSCKSWLEVKVKSIFDGSLCVGEIDGLIAVSDLKTEEKNKKLKMYFIFILVTAFIYFSLGFIDDGSISFFGAQVKDIRVQSVCCLLVLSFFVTALSYYFFSWCIQSKFNKCLRKYRQGKLYNKDIGYILSDMFVVEIYSSNSMVSKITNTICFVLKIPLIATVSCIVILPMIMLFDPASIKYFSELIVNGSLMWQPIDKYRVFCFAIMVFFYAFSISIAISALFVLSSGVESD